MRLKNFTYDRKKQLEKLSVIDLDWSQLKPIIIVYFDIDSDVDKKI
jgi:hypothetical protein